MTIHLTEADRNAIATNDSDYLNNKGVRYYAREEYELAVAYYQLASAMDNPVAISNLAYCHLYGRYVPINVDLAIGYFQIAAAKSNVDALYKLGDIYEREKWGKKDEELAIYYYKKAAKEILGFDSYTLEYIEFNEEFERYPSLCLALGRAHMPGGLLNVDSAIAYEFLSKAKAGYESELHNGYQMYRNAYQQTQQLLDNPYFISYWDNE